MIVFLKVRQETFRPLTVVVMNSWRRIRAVMLQRWMIQRIVLPRSRLFFETMCVELTDQVCFDVLFIFSLCFFYTATVGICGSNCVDKIGCLHTSWYSLTHIRERTDKRVFTIDAAHVQPDSGYEGVLMNVCGIDGNNEVRCTYSIIVNWPGAPYFNLISSSDICCHVMSSPYIQHSHRSFS